MINLLIKKKLYFNHKSEVFVLFNGFDWNCGQIIIDILYLILLLIPHPLTTNEISYTQAQDVADVSYPNILYRLLCKLS